MASQGGDGVICPLGRELSAPCPRKLPDCPACREDLGERSAMIQFGGEAATRTEADRLAVEQAIEMMAGRQRRLI